MYSRISVRMLQIQYSSTEGKEGNSMRWDAKDSRRPFRSGLVNHGQGSGFCSKCDEQL